MRENKIEELKEKVEELKEDIFMIDMIDRWTQEDKELKHKLERKLTETKRLLAEELLKDM